MAKAMLREMLGVAATKPKVAIIAVDGVRKATPERQESARMRPLERRRSMEKRQTG